MEVFLSTAADLALRWAVPFASGGALYFAFTTPTDASTVIITKNEPIE